MVAAHEPKGQKAILRAPSHRVDTDVSRLCDKDNIQAAVHGYLPITHKKVSLAYFHIS